MSTVLHLSTRSFARLPSSLLADSVNDAASTRKVYLLAGGLALLGVVLIAITVWFWRNTRHDPELLGPLEAMGARKFARLDSRSQQQWLDAARPPDAEPLRSVDDSAEIERGEQINLKVAKSSVAAGYEDLRDDRPLERVETVTPVADAAAASDELEGEASDVEPPAADAAAAAVEIADSGQIVPVADESEPSADEIAIEDDSTVRAQVNPSTASDEPVDSTAETELDEFAVLDAIRTRVPAPFPTLRPVEPVPLVIVPMDHDLPASASPPRTPAPATPKNSPTVAAEPAVEAVVDADSEDNIEDDIEDNRANNASIDPLLRRRDGSDD
ncbi:MAG: hypothetical protein ABIR32_21845 [Ilumatobacteraceae bacterium]